MELDLSTVKPCVAGPKRPHDRVELANMQKDFQSCMTAPVGFKGYNVPQDNLKSTSKFTYNGEEFELT
jgi:aconitate hydratase